METIIGFIIGMFWGTLILGWFVICAYLIGFNFSKGWHRGKKIINNED
jgi:hypothetical protein